MIYGDLGVVSPSRKAYQLGWSEILENLFGMEVSLFECFLEISIEDREQTRNRTWLTLSQFTLALCVHFPLQGSGNICCVCV